MARIGGSILPSSEPRILQPITGKYGVLQVIPVEALDTYALQYTFPRPKREGDKGNEPDTYTTTIVTHPNGYSCHNLADRIIKVWNGEVADMHALKQFDYILDCGGMAKKESAFREILKGL